MLYLVNRRSSGTMVGFLESFWAEDMVDRIRVVTYQDLLATREIPAAPILFTDHEMFTPSQRSLVAAFWKAVGNADWPRWNDPGKVLRRPALLRALYETGVNRFRAVPATDSLDGLRYPVFVRQANEHTGSLTGLLRRRKELDRTLRLLTVLPGYRRRDLLVVEFCDTRGVRGLFPKYSVFRVGERILPRCLMYSRHWMAKNEGLVIDEELAERELDFMRTHPHEAVFREIFDRAGIDYGRADYSLQDGRVQVWEINTNPRPAQRPFSHGGIPSDQNHDWPFRREAKEMFFSAYRDALREMDRRVEGEPLPWSVDRARVRRLEREEAALRRRHRFQGAAVKLRRLGWLRAAARRATLTSGG